MADEINYDEVISRLAPDVERDWDRICTDTSPLDPATLEPAVRGLYESLSLPYPSQGILYVASPRAGRIVQAFLAATADVPYLASLTPKEQVAHVMGLLPKDRAPGAIRHDEATAALLLLREDPAGAYTKAVEAGLYNWSSSLGFGNHEVDWLPGYDLALRAGDERAKPSIPLLNLAKACHWYWTFEDLFVACERPSVIHLDDQGRLHCTTGRAIEYPDGWGVCVVRDVAVPDRIILQPETITAQEIIDQENTEVRRVMMELFGYDRFVQETKAKLVDRSHYGSLYHIDLPTLDEPLALVKMVDATPVMGDADALRAQPGLHRVGEGDTETFFKVYWERVPPTVKSARDALAWQAGLAPESYHLYAPEIET